MEIQSKHWQGNINKRCKDVYMDAMTDLVREFSENAKFYMSSEVDPITTSKINAAICDMLKFNKYRDMPMYLIAEAFGKGALGELGCTTRYTVRNVCVWLNASYDKMCEINVQIKSKEDAERRIASEKNYVNIKNRATMYGSALMRKLELQYGGQMLDGDWERMTLDKIVDLMDKGYRVEEIIPGLVL